jgi:hypothetical protein
MYPVRTVFLKTKRRVVIPWRKNVAGEDRMKVRSLSKGEVQELLVMLYLRLNGYVTTGFIVHSPEKGRNRTEIDVLGVRFPHNTEPERQVTAAGELSPSASTTDVVLVEVKSKGRELQFNAALRTSVESIRSVLRWVGLYTEAEIVGLAEKLVVALDPKGSATEGPPSIEAPRRTRIRGLLCSPERFSRAPSDVWFISGEQIFEHISKCLHPTERRGGCAVSYDFGLWGPGLEPLVRFFKSRKRQGRGDVEELLTFLA